MTSPLLPWLDGGTSNPEDYQRQSRENKEINSGYLELHSRQLGIWV